MATTSVHITHEARETLRTLMSQTGKSAQDVLSAALEAYRRERLFDQADAAYAALRADPEAWREIEAERAAWDATLMDGLEDE